MPRVTRIGVVQGALLLFAVALIGRAALVQLRQRTLWGAAAQREHAASGASSIPRGMILDATGAPLIESRSAMQLGVSPRQVRDPRAVARALAAAGVPSPWVSRALDRHRAWVAIPTHLMPGPAARAAALPGVYGSTVQERVQFVSGVASGIEVTLDSVLQGDTTRLTLWRDGRGRVFAPAAGAKVASRAGNDVVLTINHSLQDICDRALTDAVARMSASGGDIVVVDPRDGAVLAVASRRNDSSGAATAFTEPFEAGSTLKPLIAAALLRLGRVQPSDVVDTHAGQITIAGRTIHDAHPGIPQMTLREVIRWSSNVGIVQFAARLSRDEEYEALRDVGFGMPTGVPYPAEAGGTLREPHQWSAQSPASLAMGYEVAVTPIQLAMAYAAIANGGELLEPALIQEIRGPHGTVWTRGPRRVIRRVMSPDIAAQLREMLIEPVAHGTAVEADLSTFIVGGKTGTARRVESNGSKDAPQGARTRRAYRPNAYTATFVGLFPAREPRYVILVKIDDPAGAYYAGSTAAPVSKTVLEAAIAARDAALDRSVLAMRDRGTADTTANSVPPETATEQHVDNARTANDSGTVAPPAARSDTTISLAGMRNTSDSASESRESLRVPDVRHMPLRAAVRALHEAGLRVALDAAIPEGTTAPSAGTELTAGALVQLGHTP